MEGADFMSINDEYLEQFIELFDPYSLPVKYIKRMSILDISGKEHIIDNKEISKFLKSFDPTKIYTTLFLIDLKKIKIDAEIIVDKIYQNANEIYLKKIDKS